MTPMELVDESAIQNVASRNPASLLRTITLPVYQVLVTSTPTPHINKSPYPICRRPLDESGRRGGRGLGLKGRANDGFDLRYMKNRVNVFKRGGLFESHLQGLSTLEMMNGPTNLGPSLRERSLKGRS